MRRSPDRPEAYLTLGALEPKPSSAREHLNRALALSRDPELTRKAQRLLQKLESVEP